MSVGKGAIPGAPANVTIDPDTDVVQTLSRARTVGKAARCGSRSRGRAARTRDRLGHGAEPLLPLGGAARDRRSAEVLRRRAEEPAPAAGIELTGSVIERTGPADNAWMLVATTESDILPTLAISNKRSQSFYAEQIFKTLAYEKTGRGSWDGALALPEGVPGRPGPR